MPPGVCARCGTPGVWERGAALGVCDRGGDDDEVVFEWLVLVVPLRDPGRDGVVRADELGALYELAAEGVIGRDIGGNAELAGDGLLKYDPADKLVADGRLRSGGVLIVAAGSSRILVEMFHRSFALPLAEDGGRWADAGEFCRLCE